MSALLQREGAAPSAPAVAAVSLALIAIGFVFAPVAFQMISIWNTYNYQHCYLVPITACWLAWRDRATIDCTARPWLPGVLLLSGAGLVASLGRIVGISFFEQAALVATVPGVIALVFGWRTLWSVAYPVGTLFLMVPFGESLVPVLVDWTAHATVAAVNASGVPIYRVGNTFELPTGRWSVVEACSGLRYILASLLLATIYAKLSYRRGRHRTLFIVSAVVLAIIGNWLRAYLVVMIGHFSHMRYGTGDDHLWFGWVLFGALMGTLFWAGARWADTDDDVSRLRVRNLASVQVPASANRLFVAAALGVIATAAWQPVVSGLMSMEGEATDFTAIRASVRAVEVARPDLAFRPDYAGGVERLDGILASDPSVRVLAIRYARQEVNGEMVTSRNRVVAAEEEQDLWRIASERRIRLDDHAPRQIAPQVNEYVVTGQGSRTLVWEWFVIGDSATPSRLAAKLRTASRVLRAQGDEAAVVLAWVPLDGPEEAARRRLSAASAAFATLSPSGARP